MVGYRAPRANRRPRDRWSWMCRSSYSRVQLAFFEYRVALFLRSLSFASKVGVSMRKRSKEKDHAS